MPVKGNGQKANKNAMSSSSIQDLSLKQRLLNSKEIGLYLGMTSAAIYQRVSRRQIPFIKWGRATKFDLQKINEWLEEQSVEPLLIGEILGEKV